VVFHTNTIPNLNLLSYRDGWLEENAAFYAQVSEENPRVHVYIENMFDFTPDLLCRLAERLSRYPNFGVCLDFAHACLSPTPIGSWVAALKPFIRHCHLNDCDGLGDSHWPLGSGILDIEGFFALLTKYGIKSTLLLEVRGIEAQRQSLEYLQSRGLCNRQPQENA
jgi:sugar phosphate isomerase/epimerase